ncbi:MAG TPA: glucosaminidase domain-containing protein [Dictyobacter sp.]|nr:glucosaminidase domain-containing protein [Dictyobacter sp.]
MENIEKTSASASSGMLPLIAVIVVIGLLIAFLSPAVHHPAVHQQTSQSVPSSGMSIYGKPTITIVQINKILSYYHSPAAGQGQAIYNEAVNYGIDPAIELAFFWHESGFGENGMARITHSIGNLRCIDNAACVNTQGGVCQPGQSCYASFPSYDAGAKAWCALLSSSLYRGDGLTTVESIIPRYAPAADNNDEQAYINSVETAVQTWRSGRVEVVA